MILGGLVALESLGFQEENRELLLSLFLSLAYVILCIAVLILVGFIFGTGVFLVLIPIGQRVFHQVPVLIHMALREFLVLSLIGLQGNIEITFCISTPIITS